MYSFCSNARYAGVVRSREKDSPFIAGSRHDLPPNRMELIRQQIAHELVAVHHFEHPAGILIRELPI